MSCEGLGVTDDCLQLLPKDGRVCGRHVSGWCWCFSVVDERQAIAVCARWRCYDSSLRAAQLVQGMVQGVDIFNLAWVSIECHRFSRTRLLLPVGAHARAVVPLACIWRGMRQGGTSQGLFASMPSRQ